MPRRLTSRVDVSGGDGRTAAARPRNRGVDHRIQRLDADFGRSPNQQREVKGVTKGRGVDLRECRAHCAGRIGDARGDLKIAAPDTGDVTEFMNHSTLLRREQQQEA